MAIEMNYFDLNDLMRYLFAIDNFKTAEILVFMNIQDYFQYLSCQVIFY